MKKELSVRRLFIDSIHFIRNNLSLLGLLTILSFVGFYAAARVSVRNIFFYMGYATFIYLFYYMFVGLYFGKKPLWTAERFVESFVKMLTLLVMSCSIWLTVKFLLNGTHFALRHLSFFSDLYPRLRQGYLIVASWPFYSLLVWLAAICLLAFSFFIPGLAWIAAMDDKDASLTEAYARVRGNFWKSAYVFVLLYGVLPLLTSLIGLRIGTWFLALLYTFQTVFQLIVYLHLYAFFYRSKE
jgi:hypothetical protein